MLRPKLWANKVEQSVIIPELRFFTYKESWMKIQYFTLGLFFCSVSYVVATKQWVSMWSSILVLGISLVARYAKTNTIIPGIDEITIGRGIRMTEGKEKSGNDQ